MTRRLGKPSYAALKRVSGRGWTTNCLVVFGVLVSLGLIGVSALLNFRMGFRSADTVFDGWVYGLGAAFADGLKAVAPFVLLWGWRERDVLAVLGAGVLFLVCTAYSLTAGLGFAAQHRAAKESENVGAIEKRGDLRRQLERAEARLMSLGVQRSPTVVSREMEVVLRSPVGRGKYTVREVSKECTRERRSTRKACEKVIALTGELARAEEQLRLERKVVGIREALDGVNDGAAVAMADPQAAALVRIASVATVKVQRRDVQFGLAALMALLVEVGSGVGLYVATTPWRRRNETGGTIGKGKEKQVKAGPDRRLGKVEEYALERLEPCQDSEVKVSELFADYQVWCGWRGEVALSRKVFAEVFEELAVEIGMRRIQRQRQYLYEDVRLVGR